jgi:hypothetical protein
MSTSRTSADREPTAHAGIVHARSQISATGLLAFVVFAAACGSTLQKNADGGPDGATSACADIQQAYADALKKAQECSPLSPGQCDLQVQSGFWCNCTTWANGGADTLKAIANQYTAAGCQSPCNGSCVQPQSLTCMADSTSSTGGRCQPTNLLNLTADNDGQTLSVPIGYEIDITLSGPPLGYEMNVMLSVDSSAATVLEVTIPAGLQTPAGPTYLYRLKALASGLVVVQIPHFSATSDASQPAYTVTLNIS